MITAEPAEITFPELTYSKLAIGFEPWYKEYASIIFPYYNEAPAEIKEDYESFEDFALEVYLTMD